MKLFLAVLALTARHATAQAGEGVGRAGQPLGATVAVEQTAYAKGLKIAPFTLNGVPVVQDRSKEGIVDFKDPARRLCPPFCVQPTDLPGITTIKVEDFATMAADINAGKVLIVDMRTPDWYAKGTLPGAINLPYSDLTGQETKAKANMKKLAGKDVIGFCNGWWCGQSPTALKALVNLGFSGKLYYFRGGNQDWVDAGLALSMPAP
ncbi:MAG: rhodanese-like domain-containing protein [Magnetococcales bacterium]|nr:rhodanese-like domain-containing protein [Magnetococcales bacterium]